MDESFSLTETRGRPPPLQLSRGSHALRKSPEETPISARRSSNPLLSRRPGSPMTSPTSPTSRRMSNSVPMKGGRLTSPPPPPRAPTPSQPSRHDLDEFTALCRAMYYDQDAHAGQEITERLAGLRHSERAQYAKLQASIRATYHHDVAVRKKAEFQAHLTSTYPGCSLSPAVRANRARQPVERLERFNEFVGKWCTSALPGTTPFFEALWAMMRLQTIPIQAGGAGQRRIDWDLDDAVFQEAAGKHFMLESIDILKGVLGFEETQLRRPGAQALAVTQPLSIGRISPERRTIATKTLATRPRAASDPFLDTPRLSHSVPSATSLVSETAAAIPHTPELETEELLLCSPAEPPLLAAESPPIVAQRWEDDDDLVDDEAQSRRIWTFPDLGDIELNTLLASFPPFITSRRLPRFTPPAGKQRARDLESADEPETLRCGTGGIWIGEQLRSPGYRGSFWQKLRAWWRRMFC